ncbi:hypothetical protein YC2023_001151 [Brassica napus]
MGAVVNMSINLEEKLRMGLGKLSPISRGVAPSRSDLTTARIDGTLLDGRDGRYSLPERPPPPNRLAFANSAAAQSAQPGPLTHLSAEDTRNVAHEAEPFYRRRDRHGRPFGDRVSTKAPLVQPLRNKITPRQGALYSEKGEHHREQQRHLSPPYTRHREHRRASRADNPQLYKQRMEPVVRHPRAPSATSRDTDATGGAQPKPY